METDGALRRCPWAIHYSGLSFLQQILQLFGGGLIPRE